jgi:putative DNA primase/helicase
MGVFNVRRSDFVKERARGKWRFILESIGVDPRLLDGKGHPCPVCPGGKDRFSFTDKWGNGDYYCRHCGHGDGFKLAQACLGLSFVQALERVESALGVAAGATPAVRAPSGEYMRKLAKRIWDEALPVQRGDEVDRYLSARGLGMDRYPAVLRCHPKLAYYAKKDGSRKSSVVASYAAMIAPLTDADGRAVTIHRTYVAGGRKAPVPDPKKVLNSFDPGPAIRLFEPTDELAVAEGIETALAVHLGTGKPVWAAYSATNLEKMFIPQNVRRVCIYADNDASFTGAAAAYALARRLRTKDRSGGLPEVAVFIPRKVGEDWADVFSRKVLRAA